jgi:hypothetical protein
MTPPPQRTALGLLLVSALGMGACSGSAEQEAEPAADSSRDDVTDPPADAQADAADASETSPDAPSPTDAVSDTRPPLPSDATDDVPDASDVADTTDGSEPPPTPPDGIPGEWVETFESLDLLDMVRTTAEIDPSAGEARSGPPLLQFDDLVGFGDDGVLVLDGTADIARLSGQRFFQSVELRNLGDVEVPANVLWRVQEGVRLTGTRLTSRGEMEIIAGRGIELEDRSLLAGTTRLTLHNQDTTDIVLRDSSGLATVDRASAESGPIVVRTRGGLQLDDATVQTGDVAASGRAGAITVEGYGGLQMRGLSVLTTGAADEADDVTVRLEGGITLRDSAMLRGTAGAAVRIRTLGDVRLENPDDPGLFGPGIDTEGGPLDLVVGQALVLHDRGSLGIHRRLPRHTGALTVRAASMDLRDGEISATNQSFSVVDRWPSTQVDLAAAQDITIGETQILSADVVWCDDGGSISVRAGGTLRMVGCACAYAGGSQQRDTCEPGLPGDATLQWAVAFEHSPPPTCACEQGAEAGQSIRSDFTDTRTGRVNVGRDASLVVDVAPGLRSPAVVYGAPVNTEGMRWWLASATVEIAGSWGGAARLFLIPESADAPDGLSPRDAVGRDLLDGWTWRAELDARLFDRTIVPRLGVSYVEH